MLDMNVKFVFISSENNTVPRFKKKMLKIRKGRIRRRKEED
jgi:hypothetical protein